MYFYVLGDELSDLDSLELTSSEDESSTDEGSDSESNKSWETEDEEEEFGGDGRLGNGMGRGR